MGEKIGELSCGICGTANQVAIGQNNYKTRTDSEIATRDTALAVCGPMCDASAECGGFNYVDNLKACFFRKDATCKQKRNTKRDCYVKDTASPTPVPTVEKDCSWVEDVFQTIYADKNAANHDPQDTLWRRFQDLGSLPDAHPQAC